MLDNEKVQALLECHNAIKALEETYEKLKTEVKSAMVADGLTTVKLGKNEISLTTSMRNTPVKDILTQLSTMNLVSCIKTQLVADIDLLKLKVGAGITQAQYDSLVKQTPVLTMKIK